MLRTFPRAELTGVEIDRAHMYGAERFFRTVHPDARFVIGDVQSLPLKDDGYDLIMSVDVMEHIPDDEATFLEFHRVLKAGGYFVMHTPRDRSDPESATGGVETRSRDGWTVGEHVRDGYRDADARRKLSSVGFEIMRTIRGYGPMGMIAWTLLQRIPMSWLSRSPLMIIPVVFYLPLVLIPALTAMLLDLIPGNHARGGSLLVVCRKKPEGY